MVARWTVYISTNCTSNFMYTYKYITVSQSAVSRVFTVEHVNHGLGINGGEDGGGGGTAIHMPAQIHT